jgi:hypothetical protein
LDKFVALRECQTKSGCGRQRHSESSMQQPCRLVKTFMIQDTRLDCQSEQASKCKQRFEKNREKLFTFLNHDSIPWHNNNAEHAIKAFAQIRDIVRGSFTERTVRNNLVLLSICQTCKCSGMDFFEFLRSGEKDIYAFGKDRVRAKTMVGF